VRILIVGLKKRDTTSLEKRFKSQGFTTVLGDLSEAAMDDAKLRDIDLAIIDSVGLENANLDTLRELGAYNVGLPVLHVSDRGMDGQGVFRDAGMVPHQIERPYTVDDLSGKVRTLLPVVPQDGAKILRAGDMSVDLETRTVMHGESEVSLTPKEMALFEYFLANPNQVLTRAKLLEGVWGLDFDPESNIVDVYIRYLREKLGSVGKKDLVETVRGAGYRVMILSEAQTERKRQLEMSVVTFTAAVASILLIAGLFITYFAGTSAVQDSQGPNFEQIAKQTAQKTESALDRQTSIVKNLAISPDVRELFIDDGTEPDRDGAAEHFMESMRLGDGVLSRIQLAGVDGSMVTSTVDDPGAQAPWVDKAIRLNSGQVAFGDIRYPDGRPVLDLTAPVQVDGETVGALRARMELQGMLASITGVDVGETGHTMLVDSDGAVVICPIFAPNSHQVDQSLLQNVVGVVSGWEITDDNPHGGDNSVAGYASVKLSDVGSSDDFGGKTWHILLTQSPEETYGSVYSSLLRAGMLGVVATIFVTFLAYKLGRRIINPAARQGFGRL